MRKRIVSNFVTLDAYYEEPDKSITWQGSGTIFACYEVSRKNTWRGGTSWHHPFSISS